MESGDKYILTINGGSSSIKLVLYNAGQSLTEMVNAELQKIGSKEARFVCNNASTNQQNSVSVEAVDYEAAITFLTTWFEKQDFFETLNVIGHRIVYGMYYTEPVEITDELLNELKLISSFDPEHMPGEIKLIEALKNKYPQIKQIACFDTGFHTSMPPVAKLLPIPRRYYANGVQRYGFHGLSYAYLLQELERVAGHGVAQGKIIMAHLGSGASLAAVKDGKSIDTSMGFTPSSGIPMSSRTGDLDPGVMLYLIQQEKLTGPQLAKLVNHESGLLGVSETTGDMQGLLKKQGTDNRAAEAVELFCYQTKKYIGSFAAALGGLDTLIFSGGIGENSPEIRERICSGLQFLGIELDKDKNNRTEAIISSDESKVTVRVIRTNEELMIAKLVCRLMNYTVKI